MRRRAVCGRRCSFSVSALFGRKSLLFFHQIGLFPEMHSIFFIILDLAERSGVSLFLPSNVTADQVANKLAEIGQERVDEQLLPLLSGDASRLDYAKVVVILDERLRRLELFAENKNLPRLPKGPCLWVECERSRR